MVAPALGLEIVLLEWVAAQIVFDARGNEVDVILLTKPHGRILRLCAVSQHVDFDEVALTLEVVFLVVNQVGLAVEHLLLVIGFVFLDVVNDVVCELEVVDFMWGVILVEVGVNFVDDVIHGVAAHMEVAWHFGQLKLAVEAAAFEVGFLVLHLIQVELLILDLHAPLGLVLKNANHFPRWIQPDFLHAAMHIQKVIAQVVGHVNRQQTARQFGELHV